MTRFASPAAAAQTITATTGQSQTANGWTNVRQWKSRPADQRYASLDELHRAVSQRRRESWTTSPQTRELQVLPTADDLALRCYDATEGVEKDLTLSNWSFGQLSQYAQAPAKYLKTLPPELAALNLQWGLERSPVRDSALILAQTNGHNELRAMTSQSYGRIWDKDVVEAIQNANADSRWVPPCDMMGARERDTTLYASDRDVFVFMIDPVNEIEVNGEILHRGFYAWNSEVGSATFGLATFLYRQICANRCILGMSDVRELKIRHTGGAPERFAREGRQYLQRYANESPQRVIEQIKAAQANELPINDGKDSIENETTSWLQRQLKLTRAQAKASYDAAVAEEGRGRTFWQIAQGITAHARSVDHTDTRVALERAGGRVIEMAASAS